MKTLASRRGVALALVLWLVVALSAVAISVVAASRLGTNIVLNARAHTVARYAAESGIVAGVAALEHWIAAETVRPVHTLAFQGVDRELAQVHELSPGQARFQVGLINLNARLDLNQAKPEVLTGLLSQFTSPDNARAVVEALRDWRDADDLVRPGGAERQTYIRAGSPYIPANAPFGRLDELRRVRGVGDALAQAVMPYLTADGDARIDVNAAPEVVLASVPGIGRSGARSLVLHRRGKGFTSIREVQAVLGTGASIPNLAVTPDRLLLVSRGFMPGHPLIHEIQAAYAIVGSTLVLKSWRELDL